VEKSGVESIREFVNEVLSREDLNLLKSRSEEIHLIISRIIDEHFDELVRELDIPEGDAAVIVEKLREIPRSMDMEDMGPILDMAFLSIKFNVSYVKGARVLLRIIRYLGKSLQEVYGEEEAFRMLYALERFAMIFIVILAEQMHKLYFMAVRKATGMSEILFGNYVRIALNELERDYAS